MNWHGEQQRFRDATAHAVRSAWRLRVQRPTLKASPYRNGYISATIAQVSQSISLRFRLTTTFFRSKIPLDVAGTEMTACANHLSRMGGQILPTPQRLRADPLGQRELITEGFTLLSYILRDKPRSSLLRLYVKAVKQTEPNSAPIELFILFVKFPGLLRFIEPIGGNSTLAKRLKLAAVLTDSSAYGPYPQTKRGIRLMKLMVDLALDIVALPFRAISSLIKNE
jgi:hypothetical protein